jgi:hypothetical protein
MIRDLCAMAVIGGLLVAMAEWAFILEVYL